MEDKAFRCVDAAGGYKSADPLPNEEELTAFYHQRYYQQSESRSYQRSYSDEELAHKRLCADQHVYAIEHSLQTRAGVPLRKLLDVGCGEGYVLASAADRGWEVSGIDFSGFAVENLNPQVAEQVRVGDAYRLLEEAVDRGERYHACTLNNVLEHVLDPEALIQRLATIVEPGGVLVVTVPNDYSDMQQRLLEIGHVDREYWFSPPQHLHYFNCNTLPHFFEEAGCKVLDLYGGFPIELFLFHPASNYVNDQTQGKAAHHARVTMDLMMAGQGMEHFHNLGRAMAKCGIGRTLTIVVRTGAV